LREESVNPAVSLQNIPEVLVAEKRFATKEFECKTLVLSNKRVRLCVRPNHIDAN